MTLLTPWQEDRSKVVGYVNWSDDELGQMKEWTTESASQGDDKVH
jgi:hypothetical protein